MHGMATIIKKKEISVEKAREYCGDILVRKDIADWYSSNDYRERLFEDGSKTKSLKDFIKDFGKYKNSECLDTFKIDVEDTGEIFATEIIITPQYWGVYCDSLKEDIEKLAEEYREIHFKYMNLVFEKIIEKEDINEYDVTLLDYHY